MILNEGEVKCKKCDGTGRLTKNHHSEDVIVVDCQKCHGKGKIDWVSNAMSSIKTNELFHVGTQIASYNPSHDISFFPDGKTESLKICENGDFIVKGKKVVDDKKVYKAFVDFLKQAGTYI